MSYQFVISLEFHLTEDWLSKGRRKRSGVVLTKGKHDIESAINMDCEKWIEDSVRLAFSKELWVTLLGTELVVLEFTAEVLLFCYLEDGRSDFDFSSVKCCYDSRRDDLGESSFLSAPLGGAGERECVAETLVTLDLLVFSFLTIFDSGLLMLYGESLFICLSLKSVLLN